MNDTNPMAYHQNQADERLIKKIASRYRMVNIVWIVISILLFGTVVGSIAALWNLYAVFKRWNVPNLIEARDPRVPSIFADTGWYVTFLLINLVLGGVVGAIVVGYEFLFVRGEILKHRHLFSGMSHSMARA
jgi:hypothetical protein